MRQAYQEVRDNRFFTPEIKLRKGESSVLFVDEA
jgi:hypothetical protein